MALIHHARIAARMVCLRSLPAPEETCARVVPPRRFLHPTSARLRLRPYSSRDHSAASRILPLACCVQVRKVHQDFFRVLGIVGSLWLVTPMLCLGLCSVTAPASRQVILESITEAVNAISLIAIACIALPTTMVPYMQVNPTVERREVMEVRRPPATPLPAETSRQTTNRAHGIELGACSPAAGALAQEASSPQAQLSPMAVDSNDSNDSSMAEDAPGCAFASRASHPTRPSVESELGGDDDSDSENAPAAAPYPLAGVTKLKKSSIVVSR